jgi:hypothetical protein
MRDVLREIKKDRKEGMEKFGVFLGGKSLNELCSSFLPPDNQLSICLPI